MCPSSRNNNNIIYFIIFITLLYSCNKYQEKELEDLEFSPVLPNEISIVLNEDVYNEFPTIIKFSSNQIILSRFQDSEENETGYETVTLEILDQSFIEDGNYRVTIYKTNLNSIKLSENPEMNNTFFLEGLDPKKTLTLIGIDDNTLEEIKNLKRK